MTSILFEPDGSLFDQQKSDISSLFFFLFDGKSRCEIRFFRFLFVPCFYDFILFFFLVDRRWDLYWLVLFSIVLSVMFYEKLIICTFGSISLVVKKVSMKYSGDDWFLWSFRINCM